MLRKNFIIFIILSFFSTLSHAAHVEMYDSLYEIHIPHDKIEIGEDSKNAFTFTDVYKGNFNFKQLSSYPFNEYKNTYYWLRFQVINHSSPEYKWMLQAPLHTEYLELYFVLENGKTITHITGQSKDFLSRDYEVRSLAFSLPPVREKSFFVYAKIHNKTHTDLHFIITDQEPYTRVLVKGYVFLGIIYGILFLMAMYNLILFISIKSRVYIYYILYIAVSGIFISWKDGLAFQYLWPENPWINAFHHKVSIFLLLATVALYAVNFLELKQRYPKLHLIVWSLVGINFILFLWRMNQDDYFDAFPLDYMFTFGFIFSISVYSLFKGFKSARYFILGSSFMLGALIILKLRYHGLMEWSQFTEDSLNYAVVFEAIAMSFALRDKLVQLRIQKESAQQRMIEEMKDREKAQEALIAQMEVNEKLKDKVNKELEGKVAERTKVINEKVEELNVANEKLDQAYKQLSQMSSKLDIDNWDLKKNLKEELMLRIQSKEVPYSKFIELFPNETDYFRLLYELKWGADGEGFKCNRCDNKKSFDIQKRFSRKCTKCNYIETATANTLFHGIKFEISKAFYIAYVSCKDENISATQISDEIELRINTCAAFKKKVNTRMDEYKAKNKTEVIKDWLVIAID